MDQISMYLFLSGSFLLSDLLGLVVIPNILLISYKKRLFDQPDLPPLFPVWAVSPFFPSS